MTVAVIIPTYQAASYIKPLMESILKQSLQPNYILVIDSSSTDDTVELLKAYAVTVHVIPKSQFNHGGTRQLAVSLVNADIYVYLTQDAVLAEADSLQKLIKSFENLQVGAAYGRQLPHEGAGLLGAHLRRFNYPERSELRSLADIRRLGLRTCANSNSFAAYRAIALQAVDGFPSNVIFGEDVYTAARLVQAGWWIAYCAEARVYHSHDYTLAEDGRRYFDIGVFHAQNMWILRQFQSPSRLGRRYVLSELKWCWTRGAYLSCVASIIHSGMKWVSYRLGRQYHCLPNRLRRYFSLNPKYWDNYADRPRS